MNEPGTFKAEATGRVNLIGEHTDYNDGFVLPILIPQKTSIRVTPRSDRIVQVTSLNLDPHKQRLEYTLGEEAPRKNWGDYIQGTTALLARDGHRLGGADVLIESTVPMGAGLSSSASLLVAFTRALRLAFRLQLDDVALALFCRRVENEFVGAHVGIMDQMAISLADADHALFLDTQSLATERILLPLESMDIFVINSGIKHELAAGAGYNTRRAECEEACRLLQIKSLRAVTRLDDLRGLPPLLQKRARHILTENARVLEAVRALQERDRTKLGQLMRASHQSMRDDYEISVPGVDILVEGALQESEVYGARMTGGGFGGSIVGICEPGRSQVLAPRILQRYQHRTGEKGSILGA